MAVGFNSYFSIADRNQDYNIAFTIKGGYSCFYRIQSLFSCASKSFFSQRMKRTRSRDIAKLWISLCSPKTFIQGMHSVASQSQIWRRLSCRSLIFPLNYFA